MREAESAGGCLRMAGEAVGPQERRACLRAARDRAAARCAGCLPGARCHPGETQHRHPQPPPGTAPEEDEEKTAL